MAKTLKTIGVIAGAVALVATGVGAFAGGALAATATSVATYATVASGVANIGSTLLYKPPPARGSVARLIIDPDAPQPYVMGEGYTAGVLRHDAAYGADLKKVPNPYRFMVMTYSGAGPIHEITPYVDQSAVDSWYTGFLSTDTQLGATPESDALAPAYGAAPGWSSTSKLSGYAAIGWSLKFDKEGKVFSSGLPQLGAYGKWVKVYDPRLDSTFPGGSGTQRLNNEATWAWSENPALHAGTYAFGRYQNSKRVMGCGLPTEAINWTQIAAWANVCDANGWTIFGAVYEPMPETRWPNLVDICAAGGAKPLFVAGVLNFHYHAPRTALDTLTEADLADSAGSVTAMKGRRERINTIAPKFRDPNSNWELVPAGSAVTSATYVSEDGEERKVEWPFNLVKDRNQAAELAAYQIADARELQPITLTFGQRVRAYEPGDCLHLDIPSLGLDTDAVILTREFDPATLRTTFTFIGETPEKHDWALGRTVTAPPTPGLKQTGQERDEASDGALRPYGWQVAVIRTASVKNPRDNSDVARALLIGLDGGASATISVARHDWDYPDGTADVTRSLATITGLSFGTTYYVYFDDPDLTNTSPTYAATTDPVAALNSSDNPDRHPLGVITTPVDGGAATEGGLIMSPSLFEPGMAVNIYRKFDGTLVPGQQFKYQLRRKQGNADVSSGATWSIAANPSSVSVSVSAGLVSITGWVSFDTYIIVRSNFEGVDEDTLMPIYTLVGAPGQQADQIVAVADPFGFEGFSSASYSTVSGVFAAKSGAGGAITVRLFGVAYAEAAGNFDLTIKLQRRPIGGSWVDVDSAAISSIAFDATFPVGVFAGILAAQTGLTADTWYEYQVQALSRGTSTATGRYRAIMWAGVGS